MSTRYVRKKNSFHSFCEELKSSFREQFHEFRELSFVSKSAHETRERRTLGIFKKNIITTKILKFPEYEIGIFQKKHHNPWGRKV